MSCSVGHRCNMDLALLWLWCRPATAALIQPLAREFPYAVGRALKKKKKGIWMKQNKTKTTKKPQRIWFHTIQQRRPVIPNGEADGRVIN